MAFLGLGTVGAMMPATAWSRWLDAQSSPDEVARWKEGLSLPGKPTVYRSDRHTDARMHLGGIGTGNFEVGADGRFTTWQLFNTLRDGAVPFFFGVRAGNAAKMLQTTGGPEAPRVAAAEMVGEYPIAKLAFKDVDLPVEVSLEAFSPMAPLDSRLSSMPAAVMVIRVHNPGPATQNVSLAAFAQNPIGYDAMAEGAPFDTPEARLEPEHPNFGGNVNELRREGAAAALLMSAEPGREPKVERPLRVFTNLDVRFFHDAPLDHPKELTIAGLNDLRKDAGACGEGGVAWFEEAALDVDREAMAAAKQLAMNGGAVVFSGKGSPLLARYAESCMGKPLNAGALRPDILFEDFENGYDNWTVVGSAFGRRPVSGSLPGQQRVTDFVGKGLVNSFVGGDDATGKLVSKPFVIDRRFIRFRIGGGRHDTTQMRLIVGDRVARTYSGHNDERLIPAAWDVQDLVGQTAHIEIVDERKGDWGHVNVDQIEFSDFPGDPEVLKLLDEMLPVRFSGIKPGAGKWPKAEFVDLAEKEGVQKVLGGWSIALGKGRVVLLGVPVLDPFSLELRGARQKAYSQLCGLAGVRYDGPIGPTKDAQGFGTMALACVGGRPTALVGFEDWAEGWGRFASGGGLPAFEPGQTAKPTPSWRTHNGALGMDLVVEPGKTEEAVFLLTWSFPNKYSWGDGSWMGNYYSKLWPTAQDALREAVRDLAKLRKRTEGFNRTFYDATLPYWLLDCVTANLGIARHIGITFQIANGDIYGWEGSNGCCQPTCTHVYGYEQSLARVFPDLERVMRRIDLVNQQRLDGGVNNRTVVPSPNKPTGEQPFADGHASTVLKAYREALNTPDDAYLRQHWPRVKRAVDYLIGRDAAAHLGTPNGTLEDDQWNTYDEALHGVTSFVSGYYLAALRAGEEWAKRVGDRKTAERFRGLFEKGQQRLVELCWNGEYFQQHLPDYEKRQGEIGPGCLSDQLVGQWWAYQLGLGYILPKPLVRKALKSIFRYNWVPDLTNWRHSPRAFAGAKDKGMLICTWPKGGRPDVVMLYSDEVWTGIEYEVASMMLYEGMVEEALAVAKGARERYDGVPRDPIGRNPWSEIECGGHYARAMSSWSLLLAASGWRYDGPKRELQIEPRLTPGRFACIFTGSEGWGRLEQRRTRSGQTNVLTVEEGRLVVSKLRLEAGKASRATAKLGGHEVPVSVTKEGETTVLTFAEAAVVKPGRRLEVALR